MAIFFLQNSKIKGNLPAGQMIVNKINEAAGAAGILSAPGGGGGGGGQQTTVMMVPAHQIGSVIGRGVLLPRLHILAGLDR